MEERCEFKAWAFPEGVQRSRLPLKISKVGVGETGPLQTQGVWVQNPVHGDCARGGNCGQILEWSFHWNPFLVASDTAACAFPNDGMWRAESSDSRMSSEGFSALTETAQEHQNDMPDGRGRHRVKEGRSQSLYQVVTSPGL